jgi:hypothetical protein
MKLGTKDNLILYVDGEQAEGKKHANTIQEAEREKAADRCNKSLEKTLEHRIDDDLKVRKSHFSGVRTSLGYFQRVISG